MSPQPTRQPNRGGPGGPGGNRGGQFRPPSEFEERVVQIDRVSRVVKGGRRFRFRATMVIGDRKGRVGLGISKGQDVQSAIQKATADAKKNMITVPILDETIPFELTTSFAGAKVLLKPASAGTGIIAGGAVRPIIELAGITNILSKSLGSDNRINNAKATMQTLEEISQFDISPLTKGKAKAKPEPKEEAAA
jgi:small subunit ribosomal protein S5